MKLASRTSRNEHTRFHVLSLFAGLLVAAAIPTGAEALCAPRDDSRYYAVDYDNCPGPGTVTDGIQEALDDANAGGGGIVVAPLGQTDIDLSTATTGIEIPEKVVLVGGGIGATTLKCVTPPTAGVSNPGDVRCVHLNGHHAGLEDLSVQVGGAATRHDNVAGVACGIDGYYADIHIEDVEINGTAGGLSTKGIGLFIRGCLSSYIEGGKVWRWNDSVRIQALGSVQRSNAWRFSTHIQSFNQGIHLDAAHANPCSDLFVQGSIIESSNLGSVGVWMKSGAACDIRVVNSHLESKGTDVKLESTGVLTSIGNHYSSPGSTGIHRTKAHGDELGPDISDGDAFIGNVNVVYDEGSIQLRTVSPPVSFTDTTNEGVMGSNFTSYDACTSLEGQYPGDLCWEKSTKKLFIAQPSGDITDSSSDWIMLLDLP